MHVCAVTNNRQTTESVSKCKGISRGGEAEGLLHVGMHLLLEPTYFHLLLQLPWVSRHMSQTIRATAPVAIANLLVPTTPAQPALSLNGGRGGKSRTPDGDAKR